MSARAISTAMVTAIFVACMCACTRVEPIGEGGGARLMQNLLRAHDLDVVVEERAVREPLERAAARLRHRDTLQFDAIVRETAKSGSGPRVVVGTAASPAARELLQSIGVEVSTGPARFRYGNRAFGDPDDGLVATFADPKRRGMPITLVFANDVAAAVDLCDSILPGWKPWIRVMRAGKVALSGPLDVGGGARRPDLVRVGAERLTTEKRLREWGALAPGVIGQAAKDMPEAMVARYVAACVRARESAAGWCATGAVIPPVYVRLWSRAEDYCANGDERAPSRFDPLDPIVDAFVTDGIHVGIDVGIDDGGAGVARAGAWKMLGRPAQPWMLDAAGVEAAWSWWGRDLDAWLAHVLVSTTPTAHSGVGHIAIADLIDAQALERASVHMISPLRGALWRFLRERESPAALREIWQGTRALDTTPALDAAFDQWVRAHAAPHADADREARARTHAAVLALPILRGVGMCEPAVDARDGIRHGLGSRAFDAAIEAAHTGGADALCVTAYGVDEPMLPADFGDERALELGVCEGDIRVAAAIAHARANGMRTLLAPEFLSSESGTWSGIWSRADQAEWAAFFERYARFVEHTALLAELSGADVLSLGSGLSAISVKESEGRRTVAAETDWKRDGWARVISLARSAFSGGLVYSAASVGELDKIAFFDKLDFIGFQLVPSLEHDDPWDGHDPSPDIRLQLDFNLLGLARAAAASHKRVILTQASFSPDLHGAARILGAGTSSRAWQARQFGLLAESVRAWSARDQLAGVFAWRWVGDDDPDSIQAHDAVIEDLRVRAMVSGLLRGL